MIHKYKTDGNVKLNIAEKLEEEKMKVKKVLALVLAVVMMFAVTACKKSEDGEAAGTLNPQETMSTDNETHTDVPQDENTSDLSGTVVITGSTSVEKILLDMIDEFGAMNPDVTVNYTGTGSSAGIEDTIAGSNTLGVSSRELKEEESAQGVEAVVFAYDGIAVAVNPANEISDISPENLAKIYSGEITNWNQLGGKDAAIEVVSREGASGTRSAFEELIGLEDEGGLSESVTVVEGNGNVQASVAGNENAIGYVSFSYIDDTVKALTVGGVEPTAENAKAGTYQLSRPFLFATKEENITPEAQAFIDFALSEDGQSFVEEHGGIKIN